jgi:hypothetical protein
MEDIKRKPGRPRKDFNAADGRFAKETWEKNYKAEAKIKRGHREIIFGDYPDELV